MFNDLQLFNFAVRRIYFLLYPQSSSRACPDRPPVHSFVWTTDQNLGSDRPSHGQIRTLDQDYHFMVDEWTDFFYHGPPTSWTESNDRLWLFFIDGQRWTSGRRETVHLTDGFRRRTMIICPSLDGLLDGRSLGGGRWTKTDRPLHGRIQTTDQKIGPKRRKYKNVDERLFK